MGENQRSRIARAGAILSAMPEPRPIYPKHFYGGPPVPRRDVGFILMPFKPEFDPVHEAISAAIENAGLKPQRADADEIFNTRASMEKILWGIAEAEVIVADMSERNVNVFYEAGIAHTVRENVILVTQNRNNFPFDLQHIDHIIYEPSERGLQELTERLNLVIRNLPTESAFELRSASITDLSTAEIRRELRRLLQVCEREWLDSVIPDQTAVFEQKFRGPLSVRRPQKEHDALIEESITDIQPAFLRPWQPIENMGFEVIEHEIAGVLPKFVEALARAYNLHSAQNDGVFIVLGHGQLLALRTWTLWGAKALECENWDAVTQLLHHEIAVHNAFREEIRTSLCRYRMIHFPDAAALQHGSGRVDLASRSIYRQTDEFAQNLFHDLAEMKGFIGLWLFAVDLAHTIVSPQDRMLWPSWILTPRSQLESLLSPLTTSGQYTQKFVQAVAQKDSAGLNMEWQDGLYDRFVDRKRLDGGWWHLDFPEIPRRFAE